MKNYIHIYWLFAGLFMSQIAFAQPNWTVNAPDYQFTMTMVGIGVFDCIETLDENDMVAAFINDECRGVEHFNTDISGQRMAYLTIYDNVSSGSEVTFKLYDASEGAEIDVVYSIDFEENKSMGDAESPYTFESDFALTEMYLDNEILYDYSVSGAFVSSVVVLNENGDMTIVALEFVDDSLGIDNAFFTISGTNLVLNQDVDFANKQSYDIHLLATTNGDCAINAAFSITVQNTNVAPTGLTNTIAEIYENEPVGSLVEQLVALDDSPDDSHTYSITGSTDDWPDQTSFFIDSDQLLSVLEFDYETKNEYQILINITDETGNVVTDVLTIRVLDVIETDVFMVSNLITPNDDGFNDVLEIPSIELYADYTLTVFNDIGNTLYQVTENYDNTWNGVTQSGAELPTGTYYYALQNNADAAFIFKGEIHIYRTNKF